MQKSKRGVALVIVLACVVLLAALVIGLMLSVGTEVQSSKISANGASVKQLGQSAVNLVLAEIRDATADGTLCWASQPGMIRTWDNTGTAKNYYKLYSDDNMVGTGVFDHTKALVPDGNNPDPSGNIYDKWYNQKGVYIDLNAPISIDGTNLYPILDGNASDLVSYTFNTAAGTGWSTTPLPPLMFPSATPVPSSTVKVLGPLTAALAVPTATPATEPQPAIAGFWLNSKTPVDTNSPNQAPMPVKWLYVLQKGEIADPDSETTGGTTVSFTNSAVKPSSTDPIVGRMAFWTDDETAKVNVNTASEGTYWDTPRTTSSNASSPTAGAGDQNLIKNLPVSGEYQRYPGHPATTSLSAVFPSLASTPSTPNAPEIIYSVTPRMNKGGSTEGTTATYNTSVNGAGAPVSTASPITGNTNPLFATVDEFLLQPSLSGGIRPVTSALGGGLTGLSQNVLTEAQFFLTATSRAPDVNLFNQPRVSMWPISLTNDTAHRSAFDRTIAFCTTIGPTGTAVPYYFQRSDPTDPNVDLPTTNDNSGLDRNRRLLEYLRLLTSTSVPGFSSSGNATFAKKYPAANGSTGTDCDQILTEIFDYIRGATNLYDNFLVTKPYTMPFGPGGQGVKNPGDPSQNGIGQVVPIQDTVKGTRGFGRYCTLQGITLLFIANASSASDSTPVLGAGQTSMQMLVIPQFFNPVNGLVGDLPTFQYTISGLKSLKINGVPVYSVDSYTKNQNNFVTESGDWGDQFGGATLDQNLINSIPIPTLTSTSFTLSATLTVQIFPPSTAAQSTKAIQTFTIQFPQATVPTPILSANKAVYDSEYARPNAGPFNMRYLLTGPAPANMLGRLYTALGKGLAGGLGYYPNYPYQAFFYTGDVVRSVAVPADIRLVAAQTTPSASLFAGVGANNTVASGAPLLGMHTFFSALGAPFFGAVMGRLVNNADYDGQSFSAGFQNTQFNPSPPVGNQLDPGYICFNFQDVFDPIHGGAVNGVLMGSSVGINIGIAYGGTPSPAVLGDWDNSIAALRDGPFINKPDEGDAGSGQPGKLPYDLKTEGGSYGLSSTLFTPNRQIPSAVMFGSLPTGVFANRPWQTLLFRPGPINHKGLGTSVTQPVAAATAGTDQGPPYSTLPDHLILDLFTMPVVEPYAISEPLSTAGRINMNSLIVPFTYINRDTGLRAVLKSEQVLSISDNFASSTGSLTSYKAAGYNAGLPSSDVVRFPVDIDATLAQFYDRRFNNKDIFRSPSEICDIDIVPYDVSTGTGFTPPGTRAPTRADMDVYWNGTSLTGSTSGAKTHRLTGDNSRERIYATIYPRLTTKSNTFTVHYRVQTLKPALTAASPAASWAQWREGTDVVTGEYRGSQTVERYVDPNDSTLPDFADPANATSTLAPYYKFRVLSVKQFSP